MLDVQRQILETLRTYMARPFYTKIVESEYYYAVSEMCFWMLKRNRLRQ